MPGETLKEAAPPFFATEPRRLPKSLLYSIFARIGGSGLDTDAFEALRASHRGGFLARAIAYDNRQKEIPSRFIQSLRWHPVRLISFLDRLRVDQMWEDDLRTIDPELWSFFNTNTPSDVMAATTAVTNPV